MSEAILDRLFVFSDGSRVLWREATKQWEVLNCEEKNNTAAEVFMVCINESVRVIDALKEELAVYASWAVVEELLSRKP